MMANCPIQSIDIPLLKSLDGLRHLAETRRFKAWFLDQFGVLHDGKQPYPGSISTLEKITTTGAKMVIISNSSRRASTTMEKMKNLGFNTSLFAGTITSGELTHQYLQRRDDAWFAALGRSCIHMTWSDPGAISLEIIYKSAMNMIGVDTSNSITVGDSLHHDIKGANVAGIQSVFTTGGIHANELGLSGFGEVADLSSVRTLSSKYDAYPSYVLPTFIW